MADPSEVGDTIVAGSNAPAETVRVRQSQPPHEPQADYANLTIVDPAHYSIANEIARGGMGRISIARDLRLGRDVALKEILDHSGDMGRRFEREVRITARLQHPSIVSVHEAGRWPTGEPFYAMKLVSGKSLDTIIDAAGSLDGRLAALPSVLAIADAMAYAHRERVIHRDLKPQNVIVGDFGETVVIDWGLAKQLDTPDLFTSGARALDPNQAPGHTSAGEILGTLGYMPPEQAGGESVDERADVYAIGAILYHLLAGRPPFTGFNFGELFIKVREGTPDKIASIEPDAPADLIAIVERAMARNPDDRYPTAKELADDLRRFQTGQLVGAHRYSLRELLRRWARRHTPVLAATAVALVVIVSGAALAMHRIMDEHEVAIDQSERATKNQADAEKLMEVMLYDLRRRLMDVGRLDILETAARKAADYYDGHHGNNTDDDRVNEATSREQIATVLVNKGARDESIAQLAKAKSIAQTIPPTSPAFARSLHVLTDIALDTGRGHVSTGNTAAALASFREAERLASQAVDLNPDDRTALLSKARTETEIAGVVETRGDRPAALAAERLALELANRVHGRALDEDLDLVKIIATAHIGHILYANNDVGGALMAFQSALRIGTIEAQANSTSLVWAWHLSNSHDEVGKMLRANKDYAGALIEFRRALAIDERLTVIEPENVRWQRTLGVAHESIGDTLATMHDDDGALAEIRAAQELDMRASEHDPTNTTLQRDLSIIDNKLGDMYASHGDLVTAIASYRAGLAVREALVHRDPNNAAWRRDLWYSHFFLANLILKLHTVTWGIDELHAALALAEPLAAQAPDDDTAQFDLGQTHAMLAGAFTDLHDLDAVKAELQAGLVIAKRMSAKPGATPKWAAMTGIMEHGLATCCTPKHR
jgi:tetratricopeptide (TPR) repeat protein